MQSIAAKNSNSILKYCFHFKRYVCSQQRRGFAVALKWRGSCANVNICPGFYRLAKHFQTRCSYKDAGANQQPPTHRNSRTARYERKFIRLPWQPTLIPHETFMGIFLQQCFYRWGNCRHASGGRCEESEGGGRFFVQNVLSMDIPKTLYRNIKG